MKDNRLKIWLLLILIVSACGVGLPQSREIYGTYMNCPFHCRAIRINPNFTFDELLDGDLFNDQRSKGTWKFIGKNKIKAEGIKPSGALRVKEETSLKESFLIVVIDPQGAVVPIVEVTGSANGKAFKCVTNQDGICDIPKTSEFTVGFNGFSSVHKVINSEASVFTIELAVDQMEPVLDEVWLIKDNRLFIEFDGRFNEDFYLQKVDRKKEQKLFPKNSRSPAQNKRKSRGL